MPVYKDETTNTWYCKFYYSTLGGKRKQTTKRGFPTKREAKQWQNTMREKGFAPTYLRMIQNQLTALFNHASNIYGLKSNPCKRVKKMGKSDAEELNFWTKEEYDQFIATIDKNDRYYVVFEILFWCGCREGELLALTLNDIDFVNNQIRINKTYYRAEGKDIQITLNTYGHLYPNEQKKLAEMLNEKK